MSSGKWTGRISTNDATRLPGSGAGLLRLDAPNAVEDGREM
jgi:hypothetical protein